MNTIIALIMITSQGSNEIATFNSLSECELAKSQIKKFDSFCYQKASVDIDQHMNHMLDMLNTMKQKMDQNFKKNG